MTTGDNLRDKVAAEQNAAAAEEQRKKQKRQGRARSTGLKQARKERAKEKSRGK